jgi:hypothetical protein
MESALLVFMLALLLYAGWKGRIFSSPPGGRHLVFGMVLGLTVLARLDAVFVALSLALCLLAHILREKNGAGLRLRGLLLAGAGAAIILAPYLLHNLLSTGSVMPISGSLKSTFPHLAGSGYGLSRLSGKDWGKIAAAILFPHGISFHAARWGAAAGNSSGPPSPSSACPYCSISLTRRSS